MIEFLGPVWPDTAAARPPSKRPAGLEGDPPPHRKGGETADDQRRKAEAALPDVVAKLVQSI